MSDPTQTSAPEPGLESGPESGRPGPLSPTLTRGIAATLAAVTALAVVALVVQLVTVRPEVHAAEAEEAARQQATRAAERFTLQVNNFDASDVDTLQQRITPLLTTKFNTTFEKSVEGLLSQITQAKLTSRGEVIRSGVASVDRDSAEVLVVADARARSTFGTRVRHFRWSVDLVRVDGRWLVDNFTPVA